MSTEARPTCLRASEAFLLVVELAQVLGISPIKDLPGCWWHRVDPDWEIIVNGKAEAVFAVTNLKVDPYTALVLRNGQPAGVVSVGHGLFLAGADDEFIDALTYAIARATAKHQTAGGAA